MKYRDYDSGEPVTMIGIELPKAYASAVRSVLYFVLMAGLVVGVVWALNKFGG